MLMNDQLNTVFMTDKLVYKLIFKRLQYIKVLQLGYDYTSKIFLKNKIKYFNAGDY